MGTRLNNYTAFAWVLAMMLSPEGLALQGNLAGTNGFGFVFLLTAALLLHALHIAVVPWPQESGCRPDAFGTAGFYLLTLAVLSGVAVCMAAATLVTSGFVFNEVFVYWFPNFGFAFLLLLGLLALNLVGQRIAAAAQIIFTSAALIGLAGLTLAGAVGTSSQALEATAMPRHLFLKGVGLGAVALLGYDLLRFTAPDPDHRRHRYLMGIGLAAGGVLIWAWNTVALTHVPASRLADTSIPHILVAKAVMGETGRIVMGIVVIAGSLAAVNLLFRAVIRMSAVMAQNGMIPSMAGGSFAQPWLPLIGLGGLTGLLMASGFAGSDWLDISLRAGLILWLAGTGMTHLAPLLTSFSRSDGTAVLLTLCRAALHFILLATMTALGSVLIITDDDPGRLARALLTLIAIAAGLAAVGLIAARCRPANRHREVSPTNGGVLQ